MPPLNEYVLARAAKRPYSMSDAPSATANDSELAKGPYATFFQRNQQGIEYVDLETRTYYISRRWTVHGPLPLGTRIEHTGLANQRRQSKSKRRARR